ncbi:MAG: DUF6084 family protein [Micromonosporaceae bacterium]
MVELSFACLDAAPARYAAAPTIEFRLRISETAGAGVGAIALRSQLRIQPLRRRYSDAEGRRLADLFGESARWAESMKPMQFATVPTMVPGFAGSTEAVLEVPCSYDLEVATGRYFHALDGGDIPLVFLFSGTIFTTGDHGMVVQQVPWHCESEYGLPVRVWRDLMDSYFPDSGWLRLRRDTLHALGAFKSRYAVPTWDHTVAALLDKAGEAVHIDKAGEAVPLNKVGEVSSES